VKHAFDRQGIEIPYPHLTVYAGMDRRGDAPALPIRMVRRNGAADAAPAAR
jgi:small conductance mechanosensitive channel